MSLFQDIVTVLEFHEGRIKKFTENQDSECRVRVKKMNQIERVTKMKIMFLRS